MKTLKNFKQQINSCSKCGLCQSQCPIYKITGNDCTVSRGHFIMLQGLIKGDLKMSKTINHYLNLCLKCGKVMMSLILLIQLIFLLLLCVCAHVCTCEFFSFEVKKVIFIRV